MVDIHKVKRFNIEFVEFIIHTHYQWLNKKGPKICKSQKLNFIVGITVLNFRNTNNNSRLYN